MIDSLIITQERYGIKKIFDDFYINNSMFSECIFFVI